MSRNLSCKLYVRTDVHFLIYINDIVDSSEEFDFILFADDTSLFCNAENKKTAWNNDYEQLCHVSDWLIANKLSLNVDKSNCLIFNKKKETNW